MSEDLSWVDKKPALEDPEEAEKAHEILSRESGVPRGETDAADLKPAQAEELSPPPSELDKETAWFFPGLAYCMMGMDKSLFELYAANLEQEFRVTTYRADRPVALFDGADITTNPWFYTVQGIDPALAQPFCDFIETFKFEDPGNGLEWSLRAQSLRVYDPFVVSERKGVWVTLLLPECLTSRRIVAVTQQPGLKLDQLHLGIQIREV